MAWPAPCNSCGCGPLRCCHRARCWAPTSLQGHSPTECQTQADEFRHQVRRLSHHPSVVIYDGCNECMVVIGTPTGIYATFVLTIVVEEDQSRVVWPSCPALGWVHGVNRLRCGRPCKGGRFSP